MKEEGGQRFNNLYDAIRGGIFVLLTAGTSLFFTRFTFDAYTLPKDVWLTFWVMILLGVYAVGFFSGKNVRLMFSPITGILAGYILLNVLSGLVAGSFSLWWDEVKRLIILFIFALLLQDYLYGNTRRIFVLIWALTLSAAITATWIIIQDFSARFFPYFVNIIPRLQDWRGFLAAGIGNTGYVADYLAVLFPMNLLLYLHVRGKMREVLALFTLVTSYAALILCWSVQSSMGLLIAIIVMIVYLIHYKPRFFWFRRRLRIAALAGAILITTLFYITPLPINPHKPSLIKEAFASGRWHFGGESRLVIWAQTLEIIRKHPWLGCGAGNFSYQYVQQASPFLLNYPNRIAYIGQYTNAAHNELLQSWAEVGVGGPALLFLLLVLLLRTLYKPIEWTGQANRWVRIGTICAIVCAFFPAMMAYPLRLPTSSVLFFTVCSLPVVLLSKTKYFSDSLNIPVELRWQNIHLTLILENFHKPVGCMLRFEGGRSFRRFATVLVILCSLGLGFQGLRPLISDKYFKEGRILVQAYYRGLVGESAVRDGEDYMRTALLWWPDHHDCRSTLGQYLSRRGRSAEAVCELQITLKRLQAREIYEALGKSFEALGKKEEAISAYEIYFERNPIMKIIPPESELYQHFLSMMQGSKIKRNDY